MRLRNSASIAYQMARAFALAIFLLVTNNIHADSTNTDAAVPETPVNPLVAALNVEDYATAVSLLHKMGPERNDEISNYLAQHKELPPIFLYEYANRVVSLPSEGIKWWLIADIRCHFDVNRYDSSYWEKFQDVRDSLVPMSAALVAAFKLEHTTATTEALRWCKLHPKVTKTDPSWVGYISHTKARTNYTAPAIIWANTIALYEDVKQVPIYHPEVKHTQLEPGYEAKNRLATAEANLQLPQTLVAPPTTSPLPKHLIIYLSPLFWLLVLDILPKRLKILKYVSILCFLVNVLFVISLYLGYFPKIW